jgi:hypothetical protein
MATGLSLSSTSNLSSMALTIVAPAIANIEPAGPTASLVSLHPLGKGETQVNIPIWDRLTAAALSEGVVIQSPQQVAVTVRTQTASEHGLLTFASDVLTKRNSENILAEIGQMQGLAMGRLRESDLVTLFDSVTGLSNPGAGVDATFRNIAGQVAYLRTDNDSSFGPAPGKANGVFHPEQIRRFVEESTGMQGGGSAGMAAQPIPEGMTAEIVENYFRGNERLFNTRIWESGVISRDGSGDAKGSIFVPQAYNLTMKSEIDAESQRVPRLRGEDIVTVAEWGESELVDSWATEFYSAADVIA